jgi:hypothetical protein
LLLLLLLLLLRALLQVPPTAALTALPRPCLPHQTQSLLL